MQCVTDYHRHRTWTKIMYNPAGKPVSLLTGVQQILEMAVDDVPISSYTKMKSGPWLQEHLSVTSSLVHLP